MSADIYLYTDVRSGRRNLHPQRAHLDAICQQISIQPGCASHELLRAQVEVALLDGYLFLCDVDADGLRIVLDAVSQMLRTGAGVDWIQALKDDAVFKRQCDGWGVSVETQMKRFRNDADKNLNRFRRMLEEKIAILARDDLRQKFCYPERDDRFA